MSTETTMPRNPFINANIEIKIDELLAPETREALDAAGSGVKVTISQATLRRLQTVAWDSAPGTLTLMTASRAVLAVIESLGLTIRPDDT